MPGALLVRGDPGAREGLLEASLVAVPPVAHLGAARGGPLLGREAASPTQDL